MGDELAGKVVLVTGASKGIGAGIATAFGAAGANVAVVDLGAGTLCVKATTPVASTAG
jgi:NAD(P)-dependent dehydrogenase (short-subunit alcohol dehydrogenase family)